MYVADSPICICGVCYHSFTYQLGVQLLDGNRYSEHMGQIPANFATSIENVYAVRSVVSSTGPNSGHIIHSKNMLINRTRFHATMLADTTAS